jgi:hypothetical protein
MKPTKPKRKKTTNLQIENVLTPKEALGARYSLCAKAKRSGDKFPRLKAR